ncbi:hypothetical protein HAZT_HAZT004541 [Hyalella azteca]|uniref:Endonuclease/exonuclease/phosphatase domain-containing protein n=1 Tax=Hyalella azteca TaxID=294128 RepID=A0A6A0H0Q7_HYAAZ|nr:hypothetical protein HAZT_HAZT004541 [Hyalella azteca]
MRCYVRQPKSTQSVQSFWETSTTLAEILWDQEKSSAGQDHLATRFLSACRDAFLVQLQSEPTRSRVGQTPSLIDLVLTSDEDIVCEIQTTAGLGKSDHAVLVIGFNFAAPQTTPPPRFNFAKADIDSIVIDLGRVEWGSELSGLNSDATWCKIRDSINSAVNVHVPKTKAGSRNRKKWMDRDTLVAVKKKHQLYRKWLESRSGQDYLYWRKSSNQAGKACRKAQRKLEKTIADNARNNPKGFWSYVKCKTSTRSGVADLKRGDGTKTSNNREKADILNALFESVFAVEPDGLLPDPPAATLREELVDFDFSVEKVWKLRFPNSTLPRRRARMISTHSY